MSLETKVRAKVDENGFKNKGDVVRWFSLIVHALVGYAIYYRMFTEHWYYFSYTMQFNTIQ